MFTRRDSHTSKPADHHDPEPPTEVAPISSPYTTQYVEQPAPTPPAAPAAAAAPQQGMSLIAAGDTFEGKLTTTNGVRVLGTVRGTIESKSAIQVEGDALVEADVTAENVTIAGTYKGNLNCHERLEITATGRASGELTTGRILLHEGGFFEGGLHMKPPQTPAAPAAETTKRRYGGS